MSEKEYRLYHKREDGKNWALLLQNRVVRASSAAEALQAAIRILGNAAPSVHVEEDTAWAVISSGRFVDVWESELE
jgi:hypothetical protein